MATAMGTIDTYEKKGSKWVINKDANDVKDYSLDFTEWLSDSGDDTIASCTVTADPLLTVNNVSFDATTATVWLAGGTGATQPLQVTFRITTNNSPPRIHDQSIYLKIIER